MSFLRCLVCHRPSTLAALALTLVLPLSTSEAQARVFGVIPDPRLSDSARQATMLAASTRMRSPAAMALSVKEELGLRPDQVAAIEALVPIERDSVRVRMERVTVAIGQNALKGQGTDAMWTGPIDEAAIRSAACEQSRATADMMIGMMRDRHALGALLTPDQRQRFDRLQGEMMRRAIRY